LPDVVRRTRVFGGSDVTLASPIWGVPSATSN
jgi:hypothetical protein